MSNQRPLTAFERSNCKLCQDTMVLKRVTAGPIGFEHRLFDCPSCSNFETVVAASDPFKSDAAGWVTGELGHGLVTHSVKNGKLIPRREK